MEEVFQAYRQLHIKEKMFNLPSSRDVSYMPLAAANAVLLNKTCYFINKLHKKCNRAAVSKNSYVHSSKKDILNHVFTPDMKTITCWMKKCAGVSKTFYCLNLLFGKTHTWKVQCVVKFCSGKRQRSMGVCSETPFNIFAADRAVAVWVSLQNKRKSTLRQTQP